MFIDQSYFTGPLTIAQLGQPNVDDSFNDFVNRWEPIIMEAALGYDFYQSFLNGLDVGSDEVTEQRWLNLLDGCVFVNTSGIKKRFTGFKNKRSPLAGFIYFEYMKDLASQATGIGIVKTQGENSVNVSPANKMSYAYNDAVDQVRLFWEMMQTDQQLPQKVYPEFGPVQVIGYYYGYYNRWRYWWNYRGVETYSFRYTNPFGI